MYNINCYSLIYLCIQYICVFFQLKEVYDDVTTKIATLTFRYKLFILCNNNKTL